MPPGYHGCYFRIDVSDGSVDRVPLPDHVLRQFIGGSGLGVRLVLDDFGKGYSSFGYLSRANFAKIKIEQSFVRGAAGGARDCVAIVRAILALARGLGIETTAAGVETEDQAAAMRRLGVGQMQGFLFGRPTLASIVDAAANGQSDRRSA